MCNKNKGIILIGTLPPPATGQSVSFKMLAEQLVLDGWDCYVVDISRKKNFKYSAFTFSRALEIIQSLFYYIIGLIKGYRNVYITIAQSRVGFFRDMFVIWCGWICGAHVVVHLKGGNYNGFYYSQGRFIRFLIRKSLLRVDRILVLGESLRGMYDFEKGLSEKIFVVMNGLSIPFEGISKTFPDNNAPVKLVFLSNLIESKGYFDLLEALNLLKQKHNMVFEAIFAGKFLTSPDDKNVTSVEAAKDKFFSLLKEYELEEDVKYVGVVHGEEKWKLLEQGHLFILPTCYVNEGQPVSIIEAMAFGCVVVTTEFRAISDLVVDGETGFFVEYGNKEQLAEIMSELMKDRKKFQEMSLASVKRYNNNFTLKAHLDAIRTLLLK